MRWILLLTLASLTAVLPAAEPAPQADEVGIVPGDIVLGNIANFPGHAGIYVGRWKDLPSSIRDRFEGVKEQVLLRSRDIGLAESFLVAERAAIPQRLLLYGRLAIPFPPRLFDIPTSDFMK